jgi:AcrR family transcriptional regulator
LLKATIEVLIEKGYNGLTTKEVAMRAGLSNGALMHHFSSKAELVIAATAMLYDAMIENGQRVVRTPEALKNPIEGFVTDCLNVYFEWPFIAAVEIMMVARTDPELMKSLRPILQKYVDSTTTLWLDVFRKTGMPEKKARTVINLAMHFARGLGVNRLWASPETNYQQIIKDCTKLIKECLVKK